MADALFSEDDRMFGSNSDTPPPTVETQPQEPASQPAPQQDGQPRDEVGRFAPKQPQAAEPQAPASPAPVAPTPAKPQVDPEQFRGYLDEREKRQAAEARAKRAEEQLAEHNRKPVEVPSFQDNPEALAHYIEQQKTSLAFDMSETMAREKHGDEPVTSAMSWAAQKCEAEKARLGFSPFAVEYLKQKHPIDWAVKQQKRDAMMGEIGDDLEGYVARKIAEHAAAPKTNEPQAAAPVSTQPAAQAPQQSANPPPPRSLASAPSAGGLNTVVPAGEFAALDDMFSKK